MNTNTLSAPEAAQALIAYQVGDYDVVAAYSPEGAIKVLCDFNGYPDDDFDTSDVEVVPDSLLDTLEAFDQDEGVRVQLDKSLRQEIAELTEPAYVYGWCD